MKAFGIFMVGAMAVAGGIAAATYITKKKLDKENEDNYYDDWDSDGIDDDWDFEFDEDMDVEEDGAFGGKAAEAPEPAPAPAPAAAVPEEGKMPFADDIFNTAEEVGGAMGEDL